MRREISARMEDVEPKQGRGLNDRQQIVNIQDEFLRNPVKVLLATAII